ncbi:helix-turn-helix domain-containing protein [Vulcanisaeta souniana]|uniref:Transcriptional regulator n=1 Tax=Vulcanisaeta souniana JCM 11219 TaxID=1293586 RepID=A0A830E3E3_9CREN|nr:helix-turn-helix domain-containing protein [Vulcanisaeta souniana]BDR92550.1 transcriptional regulator [Vulcanisaeta souniana JCM 11219]GGI82998.1 transcriptional regulator [Vulcanisaeta souniana JCM 11219]
MVEYGGFITDIMIRIAGDIVLSDNPGKGIRKWREFFDISQAELAARLGTSPSVISDYESGRRKSPGSQFIRRVVKALVDYELERGGQRLYIMSRQFGGERFWEAIIDMRDFDNPIEINEFVRAIGAIMAVEPEGYVDIHGYTVVDSLKLVLDVPSYEYLKLYGSTTQRAAVFTNVRYGRSPMIAVKSMMAFSSLRPAVVVMHGVDKPDYLGIEIARKEHIPLAIINKPIDELLTALRNIVERQKNITK